MEEIVTERDVLIEVLQFYKDFPCLWDTSHELYCNRDARKQAFAILKECYSKFEKDATVEDIKKKLDNMRAAYRREKKKVENSKSSGAGIDDIHSPSLWYYQYFTFLNEKQKPGAIGIDNFRDDESSDNNEKAPEKKKARDSYARKESELIKKQMHLVDATKSLITSTKEQNSADAFGQSVSSQLKELPNSERWLAEKFIGDILYYAKTGELNRNSAISLNSPQSHSQMRFSSPHYRTQWSNSSSPNSFSHSPQYQVQPSHSPSPQHQFQSSHSPSPQHQFQSSHSPSPQHHIQSSHSPSPQHHIQISHSPSPQHHIQSSHSSSPQHNIQSSHSPSPQHHIQISHSPSPQHHIQSSHSPSPQHHIQSSHSPSPQHHIQISHSPSPQHQFQSSHSPSPQHQIQSSHLLSQSPHISHFNSNEIQSIQQQIRNPSLPQDQSLLLPYESDFSNETLDESRENSVLRGEMKGLGSFLIFKKPK